MGFSEHYHMLTCILQQQHERCKRIPDCKNRYGYFRQRTDLSAISRKGKSGTGHQPCIQSKRNYPEDICKRRRPCTSGTVACRTGPDGLPSTTGRHRSRIQTDKSGSGTRNGPVQRERDYSQRQRQGCVRTETNHRQISAPQRPAGLHPPLRSLQRLYTKTSV